MMHPTQFHFLDISITAVSCFFCQLLRQPQQVENYSISAYQKSAEHMYQMSLFIWPAEFLWPGFYSVLHFPGLGIVVSLES